MSIPSLSFIPVCPVTSISVFEFVPYHSAHPLEYVFELGLIMLNRTPLISVIVLFLSTRINLYSSLNS
jgi:hypothetical protein